MKRADRRRWRAATTLTELGELTALWLEGKLASQPGYVPNCGPDEETRELVPVLAALNRAGWHTNTSQPGWGPGRGYDGATWCQRAGVGGFTEPELADRIAASATAAGLLVVRHAGAEDWPAHDRVVARTRANQPHGWFGRHHDLDDLYGEYPECSDEAIAVLAGAVQLTVVDPRWGRNNLLWPQLMELITQQPTVVGCG